MAIDPKLKCNPEIFEKKFSIEVGPNIILKPIFEELVKMESKFYLLNSKNEKVKKYIPFAYVEDEDSALNKINQFIMDTIAFKTSILYCIRITDGQIPMMPIGYINLESPLSPNGLNNWSLNFWLSEHYQNKNIMVASVFNCLNFLKEMGVTTIKAIVDDDNFRSIKLLTKLDFEKEHNVSDK
ncbi:GNAT family N-acetyltransferase, partial [Flavobacterium sp. UBA6046]